MQSKMPATNNLPKKPLLAGILLAALAGCDRKVAQVPTVTRPANAIDGPTTAQTEADDADLRASLAPIPFLGPAKGEIINGETWMKYACGIMMQEEKPGTGGTPKTGQYAHVNYVGFFPGTNTVFDQNEKGHPFVFRVGSKDIIKGWNIAISTMSIGSKRRFYIPADLAYGSKGSLPKIGPNQPLIFEIELLDITGVQIYLPAPPIALGTDPTTYLIPIPPLGEPVPAKTPDGESWQKYPCGMMVQQLKPGTGDHAKFGQMARVSYVGMLAKDKSIFDQRDKDNPFDFQIGSKQVIKGWDYALSTMSEGEKLRFYFPPDLAYGEKGNPPKIGPNEPLIFEIELLQVSGDEVQWPDSATQPDAFAPNVAGPSVPASRP